MANGDQADIVSRLKIVLPQGWFPDVTPVLDAVMNGLASAWAALFVQLQYVQLQTRIATATDVFLDMAALDFYAFGLQRRASETDAVFRARIIAELFAPRASRHGVVRTLTDWTGRAPFIFEPARPLDTGAWGGCPYAGYGKAGGYGNPALIPFQAIVVAYRGGGATDADIIAAVELARPAGVRLWMTISN